MEIEKIEILTEDEVKTKSLEELQNLFIQLQEITFKGNEIIKKLQKENEKWKENARIAEENDTTLVLDVNQACKELGISEDTIIADELADKIKEKYILKDKIREKIKDLQKDYNNDVFIGYEKITGEAIKKLKELLQEEE